MDNWIKYLICFILGWLMLRITANGFSVGAVEGEVEGSCSCDDEADAEICEALACVWTPSTTAQTPAHGYTDEDGKCECAGVENNSKCEWPTGSYIDGEGNHKYNFKSFDKNECSDNKSKDTCDGSTGPIAETNEGAPSKYKKCYWRRQPVNY